MQFQHFSRNGTFAPNQLYAILKQDTIETIQFDGSFQAHLDTVDIMPTKSGLQLYTTATPIEKLTINDTRAVNSTTFTGLHKQKATVKSHDDTVKPCSSLYIMFQLVVSMVFNDKHQ